MSAIPAFGHQVIYKVIMVIVIIIKVYHVVLLFFYFDMIFFKCSFTFLIFVLLSNRYWLQFLEPMFSIG